MKISFILLLLILILGSFLRFYLIQEYPLGLYPDEAMNGNNALEALATNKFKVFYPENNGREGLFINLQAAPLKLFGNEPWVLRLVSAVFGTLTILGIYLLTKELLEAGSWKLEAKQVALLSSFFLATSLWHLNFSRIGFRAILLPFFATFGLYFLLKGLRQGRILNIIWAGIFTGLGFYSYLAFRFMPFVLAVPIIWYLWQGRKKRNYEIAGSPTSLGGQTSKNCTPCAIALFLFITFIIALPIGWYFLQNPQDFIGRSGQVSIFSAESPAKEFLKSNLATLGMFFVRGDCNWRHNYACRPELNILVAVFFMVGLTMTIVSLFKPTRNFQFPNPNFQTNNNDQNPKRFENCKLKIENLTLLAWFFFMTLPATLTREGLPHALRSIGLIPPVMIFSGLGAWFTLTKTRAWLGTQKSKWPPYQKQIERIRKEIVILFILVLLFLIPFVYRTYFRLWSENPNTYFAFSTDLFHLGKFLNEQTKDIKKYVVVNLDGVDIRGFPAPAQTVMFATDTFREEARQQKNIVYVTRENWMSILQVLPNQKILITFLDSNDRQLIHTIEQRFPGLKTKVPGDFVVLQNW